MKKDPQVFIDHILECIELIEDYLHDKTVDDFMASAQLQDAVIRRIEIIGEATKNLPQDFKEKHPDITLERDSGDAGYNRPRILWSGPQTYLEGSKRGHQRPKSSIGEARLNPLPEGFEAALEESTTDSAATA